MNGRKKKKNFLTLSETLRHNFWKIKKLSNFCSSCLNNAVYTAFIHNERNHIGSLITPIKYVFFLKKKKKRNIGRFPFNQKVEFKFSTTSSSETKNVLYSGIVEGAKRERAWKSPHARKDETRWGARVSLSLLSLRTNGGLLEVYKKRTTSRGITKLSEPFSRKFSFHSTMLPEFLELSQL